ncbi:hypothetical protein LTS08_008466 [Lithohypha guttulata]|nr:hypothetical protein LTS08_008466 [Lithohypha guttulata]
MSDYDIAIVGLGALGSAAAYYAALKGAKVIGFEQFELGHVHGSSHDTSRIVRTSYDQPEYVALAKSSYKDWADIEKAAAIRLLNITGGLVFIDKAGPVSSSDYTKSLSVNNIPYELLDPEELKKRFPQFSPIGDVDVVYTADTGIVHAGRAVTAMQFLARARGADLKEHTRVDRVIPQDSGKGVVIETSNGRFKAAKVILAADAWINEILAPLGAEIPLTVSQEQVTYYKPEDVTSFESPNFPVWIYFGDKSFYGFPCFGEPSIKAGRDSAQNFMTPEQRTYVPSPMLLEELTSFMDGFVPDNGRQTLRTITCQYTVTPDRQFIISPLEKHANIIVGLGAAHAFKFAPTIGRVLAELAIDGKATNDLSKFTIPKAVANQPKASKL